MKVKVQGQHGKLTLKFTFGTLLRCSGVKGEISGCQYEMEEAVSGTNMTVVLIIMDQ